VTAKSVLYAQTGGNYTYGSPPPANGGQNPSMAVDTMFDMASLTKVVATTSAVARLYQTGVLHLDALVGDIIGSQFNANGKKVAQRSTVLHSKVLGRILVLEICCFTTLDLHLIQIHFGIRKHLVCLVVPRHLSQR
jgi:hypothetical protein